MKKQLIAGMMILSSVISLNSLLNCGDKAAIEKKLDLLLAAKQIAAKKPKAEGDAMIAAADASLKLTLNSILIGSKDHSNFLQDAELKEVKESISEVTTKS